MGQINKTDSKGSDNDLVSNRRQAIIWTKDGRVYWRIYVVNQWWRRARTYKCSTVGTMQLLREIQKQSLS